MADALQENKPQREIINEIKEIANRENIKDYETISIIWVTVMDMPEWSKKEVSVYYYILLYIPVFFLFVYVISCFLPSTYYNETGQIITHSTGI